jgi:hypothetical protein
MVAAIDRIIDERDRQCRKGFDAKHDDGHADGSLAAIVEIVLGDYICDYIDEDVDILNAPPKWAHDLCEHIRKKYARHPVQKLVIAAAVLLAEIERLDRIHEQKTKKPKGR